MQNIDSWVDAEHAVIGALLLQPSVGLEIDVRPEHFISEDMRQIFETIQSLQSAAEPIDVLTVSERLERLTGRPWLAHVGGIVREVPGAANVKAYAARLLEKYRQMRARVIAQALFESQQDQDDVDAAIRDLMALSLSRKTFEIGMKAAAQKGLEVADDATQGITGAPTGLKALDSRLGGLHRGDLIVVGARPGQGKTAFMVNLALKGKVRAGIISSEQAYEQIGMRMLALEAGVSVHDMRTGKTTQGEFQKLGEALRNPMNELIWINDKPDISIGEIQRQARKWKYERKIDALYVDYLQRIKHTNGKLQRREQIGEVIRGLKELARELDIPVILLAQLNREAAKRGGHPQVWDLAESGEIEREADQIMLLHREDEATTMDVFVGKNRHGPMGRIELAWVPDYMEVTDVERRY